MIDLTFSESELDRVRTTITDFIANIVAEARASGAVLGLSGGIDSALTAHLAVEALGPDGVTALIMPSSVTDPENVVDAESLASDLAIDWHTVSIDAMVKSVSRSMPETADERLARGNTRARVRAVITYYLANGDDLIVLGTGNRSEAAVGYFTKHGDGAVDCHPIGALYKAQVRQLARAVGVPDRIVEKTPTAELWADQTDEEELGVEYDTLDAVLALHIDGPLSATATCDLVGCSPTVVERVRRLHRGSTHKRETPPIPSID